MDKSKILIVNNGKLTLTSKIATQVAGIIGKSSGTSLLFAERELPQLIIVDKDAPPKPSYRSELRRFLNGNKRHK